MEKNISRTIALIAAVAANGAIGFKGGIPWDSPEDRLIFAQKTAGGVLVCGRYTAEQMCGVLGKRPGRTLVGIQGGEWYTKDEPMGNYGSWWTNHGSYSLGAIAAHFPDRNIWICGGSRLYAEAMRHPLVTEMHLSFMDCEPDADAFFPRFHEYGQYISTGSLTRMPGDNWRIVDEQQFTDFTHRVYRRI